MDLRHLLLLRLDASRRGEHSSQASDEGATVHRFCLRVAGS